MNSPELTEERLKQGLILQQIDPVACKKLNELIIADSLDSTNSALQRLPITQQHGTAILAEHQTAGRGRRGRQWHSPGGGNLYLSLGWHFEQPLTELGCLSLVVALAAAQALSRAGLEGHRIKWPNDLLLDGQKLCGCLVEVQVDNKGHCHAVMGVGINIRMPMDTTGRQIDQPWTDLRSHLPTCSRNTLAALLLEELVNQLTLFAEQGFRPFNRAWREMDGLKGRLVEVAAGQRTLHGTVAGINDDGTLLLDTGDEILSLHSGEVSIMPLCFE